MKIPRPLVAFALAGHLLIPVEGHAQQVPDWLLKLRLPNSSAKAIMTPTAWGAAFGSAYLGAGAARRTPYLPSADGIVGMGYRNLSTTMGHSTGLIREQCPVW